MIYVADPREGVLHRFAEVDSGNRVRNLKSLGANSLAAIDDESLFLMDLRKGGLVSLLVHSLGGLTRESRRQRRHH